jgi:hypothetical protein
MTLLSIAEAQVQSHSKNIVVVLPTSLPELARRPGIAFQLYSGSGDGKCYLYIEQHHGQRLLVLDVTDPAHIKQVNAISLSVPGPYEFVQTLANSTFLIRFGNHGGIAMIDLGKPNSPVLKGTSALYFPGPVEPMGRSGFLMAREPEFGSPATPRDYEVVDSSNPAGPSLLCTVKQVNAKIDRSETGTIFLLGSEGLTVIRRPQTEDRYKTDQSYTN